GTVGSDQRRDLQTTFDLPLAADFKVGASLLSRKRDGYVRRLDGVELGVDDTLGARVNAVWTPSATLKATLTLDGVREREESAPEVLLNAIETGQFPGFFNNDTFGNGTSDPTCAGGGAPDNRACYNDSWVLGPFLSGSGGPSRNDVDSRGAALVLDWRPSNELAFKSLTARRSLDADFARDPDGSPYDLFSSQDTATQKQFSQELQLIATPSDRLSLVSGVYYFREDAADDTYITFLPPTSPLLIGGRVENRNHALFGELTYSLSPRLRLIGGVRYTEERKVYAGTSLRGNGGVPSESILSGAAAGAQRLRDERTTWRASLSYDLSDAVTGYATVSTGFKSGGFTTRITDPNTRIPQFGPESARLYELGLKTELPLAGLRLNTALFHSDYHDIQLDGVVPGAFGTMTFNGGDAVLQGAEAELDWVATESLRLFGTLGYLDAHYTRINAGSLVSLRDDLIRAPRWTAALGASYRLALGTGSLTPRLDLAYKSATQFEPVNTPFTADDGYTALNLNIPYEPAQGNWRLAFGIENLTDARYLIAADSNTAIGYDVGAFARPRNWSLGIETWF
ncbi:MAG TPA: TonB-dependent receptor, partial [Hyphomicrobiales bacterium]|nr:TonB-dependent receptor [Hyphomicrobiales bacterium]